MNLKGWRKKRSWNDGTIPNFLEGNEKIRGKYQRGWPWTTEIRTPHILNTSVKHINLSNGPVLLLTALATHNHTQSTNYRNVKLYRSFEDKLNLSVSKMAHLHFW